MTDKPKSNDVKAAIKSFVDRLDTLEQEKKTVADDIKDLKGEAKEAGFKPKMLVAALKERRKGKEASVAERDELDTYLDAIGFLQ